jgi:hypothetical protein
MVVKRWHVLNVDPRTDVLCCLPRRSTSQAADCYATRRSRWCLEKYHEAERNEQASTAFTVRRLDVDTANIAGEQELVLLVK